MSNRRSSLFLALAIIAAMPVPAQEEAPIESTELPTIEDLEIVEVADAPEDDPAAMADADDYIVTTDLLYERFGFSKRYDRACLVTVVTRVDGQLTPVVNLPVTLEVPSHSDLRIRGEGDNWVSSHTVDTDSDGVAAFDFLIGEGKQIFDVSATDGRGTSRYYAHRELTARGFQGKTISDRVAWQMMLGTAFQTEYDESGKSQGFQDSRFFGLLTVDTMHYFGSKGSKPRNNRWHTSLDLLFSSFPVVKTEEEGEGGEEQDRLPDDFSEFADSLSVEAGVTLFFKRLSSYSRTSRDEDLPFDAFRIGFPIKIGFITRDSLEPGLIDGDGDGTPETEVFDQSDSVIGVYSAGILLSHHHTAASSLKEEKVNRMPLRWIEARYAIYEEYAGVEDADRLVCRAGLRLAPLGNDAVPFYGGIHANLGQGPDDVRIFAGLAFDLDKLSAVLGF